MSNNSLYHLKIEAHELFDQLWKTGKRSRTGAYMVLQNILKLPRDKAHIALLNEQQLKLLIRKLEAGEYWIGAGLNLPKERKGIWQRGKKVDVYANLYQIKRQQGARYKETLKGIKCFHKDKSLDWVKIDSLKQIPLIKLYRNL